MGRINYEKFAIMLIKNLTASLTNIGMTENNIFSVLIISGGGGGVALKINPQGFLNLAVFSQSSTVSVIFPKLSFECTS